MESGFILSACLSVCIPSDRRVDVQAGVTPSPGSAVKDQDSFISAEQSGSENMCLVLYATLDRDCCKACTSKKQAAGEPGIPGTRHAMPCSTVHRSSTQHQPTAVCGVLLAARDGRGPTAGAQTISPFPRQRPKYRQGRAPFGDFAARQSWRRSSGCNAGNNSRQQQHTTPTTWHEYPTLDATGDGDRPKQSTLCSQLGGPHGISASHRAPLTHRAQDASKTKVATAGLPCEHKHDAWHGL